MSLLKNYTCKECGGVLNFDGDQEIFSCPFCGTEFDFVDFHRNELLSQADAALKRLRFSTAADKYKTLLKRNPEDFEALRGLVLAEGRIVSLEDLEGLEKIRNIRMKKAREALQSALESSAETVSYFEKLSEAFDLAEDYFAKTHDVNERTESAQKSFRDAADKEKMSVISQAYRKDKYREFIKADFKYLICGAFLLIGLSAATQYRDVLLPVTAGISLVVGLILYLKFVFYDLFSIKHSAPKQPEIAEAHNSGDKISAEAEKIREDYLKKIRELRDLDPAANGYAPPENSERKDLAGDPFTDIAKTVSCAKCGGQLYLDREKSLFECKFCGVAYGTSLFYNDPLAKARKAMKSDDFTEADQRFSHMLMVDSHDAVALLGRIFCAGKWKMLQNIELTDRLLPIAEKNLQDRVNEAIEYAQEPDKIFFEKVKELTDSYIRYARLIQDRLRIENEVIQASKVADIDFSSDVYEKQVEEKKKVLSEENDELRTQRNYLIRDFGKQKALLLRDERTRVFCQ